MTPSGVKRWPPKVSGAVSKWGSNKEELGLRTGVERAEGGEGRGG